MHTRVGIDEPNPHDIQECLKVMWQFGLRLDRQRPDGLNVLEQIATDQNTHLAHFFLSLPSGDARITKSIDLWDNIHFAKEWWEEQIREFQAHTLSKSTPLAGQVSLNPRL